MAISVWPVNVCDNGLRVSTFFIRHGALINYQCAIKVLINKGLHVSRYVFKDQTRARMRRIFFLLAAIIENNRETEISQKSWERELSTQVRVASLASNESECVDYV